MSSQELIEATRRTQSDIQSVNEGPPPGAKFDYVARIQGSTISQTAYVSFASTESLIARWSRIIAEGQAEKDALVGVINWQHKVIDFNSTYTAYLLEQIGEDEFEQAAEQMATDQRDRTPEELVPLIERILLLTEIPYTVSDFSNMLECSEESVQKALERLALPHSRLHGLIDGFEE